MEAGTWIDVLLVLAFILVGGVFAATEIALVSLRSGQVERLDTQGGRGHAVASLARDPNRFLSAVQIGVTVAGFFSAAFGASTLAPSFAPVFEGLGVPAPDTVSLVVTTLVVSYLSLVLGELVPKRLALQRSVGVAKLFAPPLGRFATVMTPVIWLLSLSTNLLVRLLGGNPDAAGDEVDEEELRMMISGHEDIPEGERRLVDDVFEAGDRSLSEVMKPRGDVVFLRGDLSLAEAVAVIVDQPYTRYPVTGTSFDEVLGYLHLRDVLGRADDSSTTVADLARELPVLPRTNRVLPSIDQLRSLGAHIALVVDEYGGTDGIVTLEDLMEELVGEIHDEYDTDAEIAASMDPTTVDAGLTIEEFGERTGVELDDGPYETVAGYVLHRLARLGEVGDSVVVEDRRLEVVEVDGRRITRVRLHAAPAPPGRGRGRRDGRARGGTDAPAAGVRRPLRHLGALPARRRRRRAPRRAPQGARLVGPVPVARGRHAPGAGRSPDDGRAPLRDRPRRQRRTPRLGGAARRRGPSRRGHRPGEGRRQGQARRCLDRVHRGRPRGRARLRPRRPRRPGRGQRPPAVAPRGRRVALRAAAPEGIAFAPRRLGPVDSGRGLGPA